MAWLRTTPLTDQQRQQLQELARSPKRGDADRARAILMTYQGQSAEQISTVLMVKAQSIRLWRIRFANHGCEGLKDKARSGRTPLKREAALSVLPKMLENTNQSLTCPRMIEQIEQQTGVRLSANYLSQILKKGVGLTGDPATASKIDKMPKR